MFLQMCWETLNSLLDMISRFCFYICFLHEILSDACLLGYLGLGRGGAGEEASGWNHHWKDITHVSTLFWIKWSEILGTTARRDSLDCTCSGHICSRNVVRMGLGEGYLCWQKLDHCYGGGKLVWQSIFWVSGLCVHRADPCFQVLRFWGCMQVLCQQYIILSVVLECLDLSSSGSWYQSLRAPRDHLFSSCNLFVILSYMLRCYDFFLGASTVIPKVGHFETFLCAYIQKHSHLMKKKHLIKERYKKAGRRIHRETAGCMKESGIKCYKNNMLLCSDLS